MQSTFEIMKPDGNMNIAWCANSCLELVFSSPKHEVLRVSYCDSAVSVVRRALSIVNFLPYVRSTGHIFSAIIMKRGQNVCLGEISDEFENGSCRVKNQVTMSNLRKTLCTL